MKNEDVTRELLKVARELVGVDPKTKAILKVFQRQFPYHSDLQLIDGQRRTLMGDGRFDIDGRRAGQLVRVGLVEIIEGTFGKELELTSKGRRSLGQSEEAWELTI